MLIWLWHEHGGNWEDFQKTPVEVILKLIDLKIFSLNYESNKLNKMFGGSKNKQR